MKNSSCNSIIIEGLDSLGKSLQTRRLVEHLENVGHKVTRVKSPFDDGVSFPLIYWMLKNGLARRLPNVFQFVHFFNKLIFQLFVLPKLLRENDFIVFDRWSISMWAYGVMDGASATLTRWMLSCISEPDFTVILDGVRHSRDRVDDSYEADTSYQKRVRVMYVQWAIDIDHENVVIVGANQPVEDVTNNILMYMRKKGFRV
jgi:thymidylate kinase